MLWTKDQRIESLEVENKQLKSKLAECDSCYTINLEELKDINENYIIYRKDGRDR